MENIHGAQPEHGVVVKFPAVNKQSTRKKSNNFQLSKVDNDLDAEYIGGQIARSMVSRIHYDSNHYLIAFNDSIRLHCTAKPKFRESAIFGFSMVAALFITQGMRGEQQKGNESCAFMTKDESSAMLEDAQ